MKYAIILGTKAEFIKVAPIMLEFQKQKIDYLFIHTGQHALGELIETFGTKSPDVVINARDGFKGDTGGAFGWALQTLPKLNYYLRHSDIKFVIVHGDTISTLLGAVAGRITGKQVVHVEAGLRSGNLREPFPEEIVRTIVDNISDIKFAPSNLSAKRLRGKVFNVGNTSVDSLHHALELNNIPHDFFSNAPSTFAIATIHRHENIKSKERMEKIINIFGYCQIPLYWFIHENTKHKLEEYGLMNKLKQYKNICLVNPLEYSQFVHVLNGSHFVFTDGGGISEECAALNIPCIILRAATEREELLNRGDQVLTKLDEEETKLAIMKFSLPRNSYFIENIYDRGGASKQIVGILDIINKNEVSPVCNMKTHKYLKVSEQ